MRSEITQNKVPKCRCQNYADSGANIIDPVILSLFQKKKKRHFLLGRRRNTWKLRIKRSHFSAYSFSLQERIRRAPDMFLSECHWIYAEKGAKIRIERQNLLIDGIFMPGHGRNRNRKWAGITQKTVPKYVMQMNLRRKEYKNGWCSLFYAEKRSKILKKHRITQKTVQKWTEHKNYAEKRDKNQAERWRSRGKTAQKSGGAMKITRKSVSKTGRRDEFTRVSGEEIKEWNENYAENGAKDGRWNQIYAG